MGIRDIEERIRIRELKRKKGVELKLIELENKAKIENMTKDRLAEIAQKHGVIIAVDDSLKAEIEELQKKYNIPKSRIITKAMEEQDVFVKSKIDHERLGQLIYQRVMMDKHETGGLLTLPDIFERVNVGLLEGQVTMKDVGKSIDILKKSNAIYDVEKLGSGLIMVSFFPVQYTSDQASVLKIVPNDGVLNTQFVCSSLNWSKDRADRALDSLEASGIARVTESYREGKKYFFPNIKR
jgi:hypothetical protein